MTNWIAFWNILRKDMKTYYLKPPNLSWGIIFPIAWTLAFFVRSSEPVSILAILPGVVAVSVLFGTTSMLAVTITFERKGRSFDRLLLAPVPLDLLMLAKTSGALVFGVANALMPVVLAAMLANLAGMAWWPLAGGIVLISVSSTFLGLLVAVSASEVFEAQTYSNFFRFPMIFLCGLFVPVDRLPVLLQPLSYVLPLTYGADILHGAVTDRNAMPLALDFLVLALFCAALFVLSVRIIRRRWIG